MHVVMFFFVDSRNKFFDPKITQQPCPTLPCGTQYSLSLQIYALKEPIHLKSCVVHKHQDKINRIGRGKRHLKKTERKKEGKSEQHTVKYREQNDKLA